VLEFVRGRVQGVSEDAAVIAVGDVGIRIEMPTGDLARAQGEVTVHTVLQIRDEEVRVYGFLEDRSRELFRALTSVSGVGPKVALALLSFHKADGLERAIASADNGALSAVPGVGAKTAARILVDLKDKVGSIAEPVAAAASNSSLGEVRDALKGLGYSTAEIQRALGDLPPDGDAPTLLRHALRALGGAEPVPSAMNGEQ
jgi:Holliday junction DNA helicase RuvA